VRFAARALGLTGPPAAALPALVALLNAPETDTRRAVSGAVVKVAAPADLLPHLRGWLGDREAWVRSEALEACRALGRDALPLLPKLVQLVRTEDADFCLERLHELLVGLGRHSAAAVAALPRPALRDPDQEACRRALRLLSRLGRAAAAAAPDVRELLGHPEEEVRSQAAYTLQWVSPAGGEGLRAGPW
jgi:HEAT repeat protein